MKKTYSLYLDNRQLYDAILPIRNLAVWGDRKGENGPNAYVYSEVTPYAVEEIVDQVIEQCILKGVLKPGHKGGEK